MVEDSKVNIPSRSRIVVVIARFISLVIGKLLFRLKFHNLSNIPQESGEGLIIAANHQTYLDPFLIGAPIKRTLRFMAWDEAFKWRFAGILLRKLGAFPVSLNRGGTPRAMKTSIKLLKEGETLIIFPEGSREFSNGELLTFKIGAARLALKANVPILPVTVKGGNEVWSRDHKFPQTGRIEVFYHPVFYPDQNDRDEDRAIEITEKLRRIIASF